MSTDLVVRDTDSWVAVLPAVGDLASKIAGTDFVPDAMRGKPAAVAAAILYGREIGFGPMQSLQSISVIKGKPSLSSEAMRAMVLAAGHRIRFVETTNTRCVVECRRAGDEDATLVQFSMDDAKRMGLAGQRQYATMPRQMLIARATSEACRLVFPDVIAGMLSDVEAAEPAPWEEPVEAVQKPARRTIRRAGGTAPAPARSGRDAVPAAAPAPVDEPPLDDEPAADPDTGEIVDAEVVEPVTDAQLKALGAAFRDIGIVDRADRLAAASAVAGRPLETSKGLTAREASELLDALAFARGQDDPRGVFTDLIAATRQEDSA